jgi:hypothetical protein
MPRKSKNQSTTVVSPGQPYGIAGEQQAAMQSVPLPETRVQPNTQNPATTTMGQEQSSLDSAAVPDPMQQLLQNAQSTPAPTLNSFSAPTERPDENLMTMPSQPIVGAPNKTAEILRMVARFQNNDPMLLAKAADAERLGY